MKSRDQKESIVDVRVCVCVCILLVTCGERERARRDKRERFQRKFTAEPLQDTYFKNKKIHRVTCTTLLKRYIS